jgi:hypothetical protein
MMHHMQISLKKKKLSFKNHILQNLIKINYYTPRKKRLGGYIGIALSIRPSVRPSMYLVSATPTKLLIEFL